MSDLQSMHTQARKLILMLSAGVERLENAEQVSTFTKYLNIPVFSALFNTQQ
jgi:thiamine pyrophosphate-dependent acetolactate synthase large subunit-like protein